LVREGKIKICKIENMTKEISKWLSDYDSGKEVESVSMGGICEGYEIAIQDCAIEIMRNLPMFVPK
jgi:DNA-binding protein YbaB